MRLIGAVLEALVADQVVSRCSPTDPLRDPLLDLDHIRERYRFDRRIGESRRETQLHHLPHAGGRREPGRLRLEIAAE